MTVCVAHMCSRGGLGGLCQAVTGFLVPTPYLWSVANHDTRGTFVSEGVFDPDAASSHAGAAVLLTDLLNRGLVPA